MKKTVIKSAAAVGVCLALAVGAVSAGAAGFGRALNNEKQPEALGGAPQQEMQFNSQQPGGMQMQFAGQQSGGQPMDFGGMQMQQGGSFGMQPMMPNQQMGGFGQNSQLPAMPSDNGSFNQDSQLPAMPSDNGGFGQNSQLPAMPGDNGGFGQNSQLPAMPGDNGGFNQNSQLPAMPGDNGSFNQNSQLPAMPGENNSDFNQNSQLPAMPSDNGGFNQNSQLPAMPGDNGGFNQDSQLPAMPSNNGGFNQNSQLPAMPSDNGGFNQNAQLPAMPSDNGGFNQNAQLPAMPGQQNGAAQSSASEAGEVVAGVTSNSAMNLEADYANAVTYTMTDENNEVKITESGTYIVTGSCADGNITVKKGTTGVVLVLKDLNLASSTGAAVSLNKESEVKVIIDGTVTLTDNEDPADEESTDADVADAYDGAALKVKANAAAYITGSGTLNIVGNAKNGIKGGDDASIVIDGVTLNITAANDGINVNYDLAILSGTVTVSASDDAIHADHILTIGVEGANPTVTVKKSTEGLEGTVVNLASGKITINSTDDAINAANADGVYEGTLGYSVNVTGCSVTIISGGDGVDSNGNVNLISGTMSIRSSSGGGEAGIDYDGSCYVSPDFVLNNQSGVAGPDNMMGGMMGGMPGGMDNMGSFGGQTGGFRR